jgi:hypothetical protein
MPDMLDEFAREAAERLLKDMPVEKRLEGLTPQQRLEGLTDEEILEGINRLPAETRRELVKMLENYKPSPKSG